MVTQREKDLLARLDGLPDLLKMAGEEKLHPSEDVYAIQERLQDEHRREGKPFRWSMPYRHLAYCPSCGMIGTDIQHELENPVQIEGKPHPWRVSIWEGELHAIRVHGTPFRPELRDFLGHLD